MIAAHCAIYSQSSGEFCILSPGDDGVERYAYCATGYAGNGAGRNNHEKQYEKNVGPLPVGNYRVTGPFTHGHMGPLCFRLWPFRTNEMRGRGGFLIHGDNPQGDASKGCIILARAAREKVEGFRVRFLAVTP